MEYSKTFCPYPWIHVMTQPTGTVSWCCVARDNFKNDDGTMFDLNKGDKIESVWNNNHMRKIRKQMIEGETVRGCEHCYDLEKMGFPSYRTNYIRDWFEYSGRGQEIADRIERSQQNDYVVEESPMYLDFRLGNLCNLKCRMCQPQNSSQIQKEYKRIEVNDPMAAQFIKDHFTWGQFADHITPWQDDPEFLRQVEAWLPGVNKLYFTGGEPTIIERVYWILEKCIEMGIAKNIDLVFNSNMTNVKGRFITIIEQFKSVLMCFSVDAYGELNEYIRGASHWEQTDENVRSYCSSKVVGSLLFSPVIQIYNILEITKLLDYCETLEQEYQREIHLTFLICDYPRSLDFRNLPDSVRTVAAERLEQWIPTSRILVKRENNLQAINALIRALKENRHGDWEKQLAIFKKYTSILDKQRNESMSGAIPELWELMYGKNSSS
jgi:sulfatase maturation enzyme AslB (radical SAM superfamily)